MARIQAALRRRAAPPRVEPPEPYTLGDLVIDFVHRRVTVAGEEAQLTATEYDLLAELAVNAGRVVTHQELLHRVWGPVNPGSAHTIRTHLMRLRHKLGEDGENPTYIFSEPRVGYRMAVGEGAEDDQRRVTNRGVIEEVDANRTQAGRKVQLTAQGRSKLAGAIVGQSSDGRELAAGVKCSHGVCDMRLTSMRFGGVPPFTEPVELRFDERVNLFVGANATGKSRLLSEIDEHFNDRDAKRHLILDPDQDHLRLTFAEERERADDWLEGKNILLADTAFSNALHGINASNPSFGGIHRPHQGWTSKHIRVGRIGFLRFDGGGGAVGAVLRSQTERLPSICCTPKPSRCTSGKRRRKRRPANEGLGISYTWTEWPIRAPSSFVMSCSFPAQRSTIQPASILNFSLTNLWLISTAFP